MKRNFVAMLVTSLVLVPSMTLAAGGGRSGRSSEGSKEAKEAVMKGTTGETVNKLNEALKAKGIEQVDFSKIEMSPAKKGELAQSLRELTDLINDPANAAKVEVLKREGLVDVSMKTLELANQVQEGTPAGDVVSNVFNVTKSIFGENVNVESVRDALNAVYAMAARQGSEDAMLALNKTLDGLNVRMEDLKNCK